MARSMTVRRTVEAGMRHLLRRHLGRDRRSCSCFRAWERFRPRSPRSFCWNGLALRISSSQVSPAPSTPACASATFVVAERLVQHDMDASPLPAFKRFEIPLLGKIFFEASLCDEAFEAAIHYTQGDFLKDVAAEKRAAFGMDQPRVWRGLIASGDQFLADPRKTAELRQALPGLLCAEMEGAAVAQVCHEMGGIPTAIIRVISDQADHSAAVDFLRFVDDVAEYLTGGIVQSLLSSFSCRAASV